MTIQVFGTRIREGDLLNTGDVLVLDRPPDKRRRSPAPRTKKVVKIEKIIYHNDLTRSFVLAPVDAWNEKLYRTLTSETTLRQMYRRQYPKEVRII